MPNEELEIKDDYSNKRRAFILTIIAIVLFSFIIFLVPYLYKLLNMGDGSLIPIYGQLFYIVPSFIIIVAREWILCFHDRMLSETKGLWNKIIKILPTLLLVLLYAPIFIVPIIAIGVYICNPQGGQISITNIVIIGIVIIVACFIVYKLCKGLIQKIPKELRHFSIISTCNVLLVVFPLMLTGTVYLLMGAVIIILIPFGLFLLFLLLKFL